MWPWVQIRGKPSRAEAVLILSQDAAWRDAAAAELVRRGTSAAVETELNAACARLGCDQPGLWLVDSRLASFPRSLGGLRSLSRARLVVIACASEHFEDMLGVAFQHGITGLVPRAWSPTRLAGSVHALLDEDRARAGRLRWF